MTDRDPWTVLGQRSPSDIAATALELHWAVQLLAAAGQTFAEPRDDDSHRAMTWHPKLRAFVGAPFAKAYPLRIAVRPDDLTLLILDRADDAIAVLPLTGQTLDDASAWLGTGAATYFGGAPPLLDKPAWEMPEHPVRSGARFPEAPTVERDTVAALYAAAAALLEQLAAADPDASEVRCWPHHFDIATLLTVERGEGGTATRTIGIGMAPAGAGCDNWYWYVSPWPTPEAGRLPELASGAWHIGTWTGAVLTGEQIVAARPRERAAMVRAFIREAAEASRKALARVD